MNIKSRKEVIFALWRIRQFQTDVNGKPYAFLINKENLLHLEQWMQSTEHLKAVRGNSNFYIVKYEKDFHMKYPLHHQTSSAWLQWFHSSTHMDFPSKTLAQRKPKHIRHLLINRAEIFNEQQPIVVIEAYYKRN
ncbi:hypothetical protein GQX74_010448 [Glossina fuscipes]|nr:hypothetical protein GQX74_010448 [Glossina fuscipes]